MTVVSSGYGSQPLTANQVISALYEQSVFLDTPDAPVANEVNTVRGFVGDAALMLGDGRDVAGLRYSGNKLSTDASQFAADAATYTAVSQSNGGQVNPAYASKVRTDIDKLVTDCPASLNAG